MVNRLSASASEFLAAALQDHNRAVIVGSQTYGKATAQRMFPLEPGTKDLAAAISSGKGFGYATVTVNKIYRVTGKTVQGFGIKPDVLLPDILDGFDLFESSLPGALQRDSVLKKTYYTPLPTFPLVRLREKSKVRVDSSEAFRLVKEFAAIIMLQETAGEIVPLSWNEFAGLMESARRYEKLESLFEENAAPYEPQNNATDINRMKVDEFLAEMNKHWLKNLQADIHLAETFHIICDYIRLNQPSK
jgi:carboxyl-terminal processing protease